MPGSKETVVLRRSKRLRNSNALRMSRSSPKAAAPPTTSAARKDNRTKPCSRKTHFSRVLCFQLLLRPILAFLGPSRDLARLLSVSRAFHAVGSEVMATRTVLACVGAMQWGRKFGERFVLDCYDLLSKRSVSIQELPSSADDDGAWFATRVGDSLLAAGGGCEFPIYQLVRKTADSRRAWQPMFEKCICKSSATTSPCEHRFNCRGNSVPPPQFCELFGAFIKGSGDIVFAGEVALDEDAMTTIVVVQPFRYNVRNRCWSLLPPMASSRRMSACVVLPDPLDGRDRLIVAAGISIDEDGAEQLSSAVEEYVPNNNGWISLPDVPEPIAVSSYTVWNQMLIVAADAETDYDNARESDLWKFSLETMQWTTLPDLSPVWPVAGEYDVPEGAPNVVSVDGKLYALIVYKDRYTMIYEFDEDLYEWKPLDHGPDSCVFNSTAIVPIPLSAVL